MDTVLRGTPKGGMILPLKVAQKRPDTAVISTPPVGGRTAGPGSHQGKAEPDTGQTAHTTIAPSDEGEGEKRKCGGNRRSEARIKEHDGRTIKTDMVASDLRWESHRVRQQEAP